MTKLKMNRKFLASNKIEIFGLDSDSFEGDPIVTINEDIVFLELKLKDDNPRICPFVALLMSSLKKQYLLN